MPVVLYQARLRQSYYTADCYTNFYFFDPLTGQNGDQYEIANLFIDNILPAINGCQSERVVNHDLYVLNVTNGADSYTAGLTGGGSGAVDEANDLPPAWVATIRWSVAGVQFRPEGKPIKSGFTHISGLIDANIINGISFNPAFISGLTGIVNEVTTPLATVGGTYNAVINRRPNVSIVDPEQQIAQIVGHSSFKVGTLRSRLT